MLSTPLPSLCCWRYSCFCFLHPPASQFKLTVAHYSAPALQGWRMLSPIRALGVGTWWDCFHAPGESSLNHERRWEIKEEQGPSLTDRVKGLEVRPIAHQYFFPPVKKMTAQPTRPDACFCCSPKAVSWGHCRRRFWAFSFHKGNELHSLSLHISSVQEDVLR